MFSAHQEHAFAPLEPEALARWLGVGENDGVRPLSRTPVLSCAWEGDCVQRLVGGVRIGRDEDDGFPDLDVSRGEVVQPGIRTSHHGRGIPARD